MLQDRAAAEGMSVSELVADMTALAGAPVAIAADDLAELYREWSAIKAGEPTVLHADVARWLQSWGTPAFTPWRNR